MAGYDFDMIVIGGGAAGLTASGIAVNFGAKTMMVEANRLGGDCTWTGCIPSKTLLKAGKVAHQIKKAGTYGLIDGEPEIDFKKLMEYVDEVRTEVYWEADRPGIYEDMGVEVVFGEATFLNDHTIEIQLKDGESLEVSSRYFIIATGARPFIPPIEGLDEVKYLTNESLFELKKFPEELVIIGAGPVGTEMAQAFAHIGSKVTVIDMADRILTNDDPELTDILFHELKKDGVQFELEATVHSVREEEGRVIVHIESEGEQKQVEGTRLLLAAGKKANTASLDLDKAGVRFTEKGITVNNSCRTSKRHIYAAGDVTGRYHFTHMSDHMAKVAATKALLKIPMKIDQKHVPWVTYTQPELGHVGATEEQLKERGVKFQTYRFPYSKIDRAVAEGEDTGLIKIFAKKWSGKILGASVVGAHAGEMISEYAVAMKNGVSLRKLADTIHPYPSWGLGARRAADQWYIKNQSAWSVRLIKTLFRYRGEVPDYSNEDRIV